MSALLKRARQAQTITNPCVLKSQHQGFITTVGENIKYMVYSRHMLDAGLSELGSSAWAFAPRDQTIGWDKVVRKNNLNYTTNIIQTKIKSKPFSNTPDI